MILNFNALSFIFNASKNPFQSSKQKKEGTFSSASLSFLEISFDVIGRDVIICER